MSELVSKARDFAYHCLEPSHDLIRKLCDEIERLSAELQECFDAISERAQKIAEYHMRMPVLKERAETAEKRAAKYKEALKTISEDWTHSEGCQSVEDDDDPEACDCQIGVAYKALAEDGI